MFKVGDKVAYTEIPGRVYTVAELEVQGWPGTLWIHNPERGDRWIASVDSLTLVKEEDKSALGKQVGGDHYKDLAIQPIEYILANKLPFSEGSVVKYITRWRAKGGVKDLEKAKHFIELLIEEENKSVK